MSQHPLIFNRVEFVNPSEVEKLDAKLKAYRKYYDERNTMATALFGKELAERCCINPPAMFYKEQKVDCEKLDIDDDIETEILAMKAYKHETEDIKPDKDGGYLISLPRSGGTKVQPSVRTIFESSRKF